MKSMKTVAFPISGNDFSRVVTSFLILGIALSERSGLITLNILKAFRFTLEPRKSTILYNIINVISLP